MSSSCSPGAAGLETVVLVTMIRTHENLCVAQPQIYLKIIFPIQEAMQCKGDNSPAAPRTLVPRLHEAFSLLSVPVLGPRILFATERFLPAPRLSET